MPVEVILPKVDMDMTHGTLAVWHVAAGDEVAKGAPLFDIETDKAAMEVESPASGRLHAITARPGDRVAVGTVVALIYAEGEEIGPVPPPPAEVSEAVADGPQPTEVILPKVDMDMTHGTLAVWHVKAGDEVAKGAALFDIETDKAAMEVEAPASGILHHILAGPGDKIPVGEVVAYIYPPGVPVGPRPAGQPVQATPESVAPAPSPVVAVSHDVAAPVPERSAAGDQKVRATPAARVTARQAGLDLAAISGSGPRGRIQRDDVRGYADRSSEAPANLAAPQHWSPEPGPLHVSTRKGNGIPLVMLHGFASDSQSWAPLEKAMGPDRALIRIDLPGHGRSPKRKIRSFAELSRMMVEAFDQAILAYDRVHLLGHSLGGALALSLTDIRGLM